MAPGAAARTRTVYGDGNTLHLIRENSRCSAGSRGKRLSRQQGRALEMLGHAIEYLQDTNFYAGRSHDPAVVEAVEHLKRASRRVFQEAPEQLRTRERAAWWLRSRLGGRRVAEAPRLMLVKR